MLTSESIFHLRSFHAAFYESWILFCGQAAAFLHAFILTKREREREFWVRGDRGIVPEFLYYTVLCTSGVPIRTRDWSLGVQRKWRWKCVIMIICQHWLCAAVYSYTLSFSYNVWDLFAKGGRSSEYSLFATYIRVVLFDLEKREGKSCALDKPCKIICKHNSRIK